MLIIFDLDDTLIQTTDITTPYLLQKLLQFLHKKEVFYNYPEAKKKLFSLHFRSNTTAEALENFFLVYPKGKKFWEESLELIYSYLEEDVPISPYVKTLETLIQLKEKYLLCLVTKGERYIQMRKLKKAGIHREIFSKILVSSLGDKRRCYQKILLEKRRLPGDTIIIGDRPKQDLQPGKELGCYTVHIKQGRGKILQSDFSDYIIENIKELPSIVRELSKQKKAG